ncbi:MAG TPA: cysteine--tRNA ligase [Tepidisphaeraceae bacterium]|jgi:cysteinyl-tRNA synthetase
MSLRVYNTLTKQKEIFEPVRPGKVGIYLCGPTVYKSPHIGHMVGPVIFDAIKRYLVFKGYDVTWVVNITDVEDKLIQSATEEKVSVQEIAEKYTREYMECLHLLGVDTIDRFPKASEHIGEIIAMCEKLIAQNNAYVADGNVWFDVTSDNDYGKLSRRKVEEQESGLRTLEGAGKRNPADFALWKSAKAGEPAWDSPWGPGRPGWHIECSAMSTKYLGETFDMHGGGMDLLFPHHENELAQSECATGKPFAKFWMHNGLTRMKTKSASGEWKMEKQSKSLGNVIDPRQFVKDNGGELLRYLLLNTHYRSPIDFSDDVLVAAKKGLSVFGRLFERMDRVTAGQAVKDAPDMDRVAGKLLDTDHAEFARAVLGLRMKFLEMMDDDFNTAGAIGVMHELAGEINSFIERHNIEQNKQPELTEAVVAACQSLKKSGSILGMFRPELQKQAAPESGLTDQLMALFIKIRAEARASKNFATADGIRKGLAELGITLEDRAEGTVWRKE